MSAALTTNVDQRLLRTTKFPPEFNTKVDMRKVNIDLIKKWAQAEIVKILDNDDDVVAELVSNILKESRYPNIKELQIQLTGFLDKDAAPFCQKLWKLCLSAQDNSQGVPKELIEAKKAELTQEKVEKERAREAAIQREEADREREREVARVRERERDERARGRGGRDFNRRPPRDSRSPPRRRRDDDDFRRAPRTDSYIPSNAGRRRRSPSYGRDQSRSRSPPRKSRRKESSTSRSPSPRRKRRNTSSEHSASPQRQQNGNKGHSSGQHKHRRSRSPPRKRQARQSRRESPPRRSRSRSPPSKRNRRVSSSPSRSSGSNSSPSEKSPPLRKQALRLAPDDLMAGDRRKERSKTLRLRRETTSPSRSRSVTPSTSEHSHLGPTFSENNNHPLSTNESRDVSATIAGAETGGEDIGDA